MPSCIRVPPEAGAASSGSRSSVARSTARTSRSAAAHPDRAGQEAELAGHHGDPPSVHPALARDDRLVEAGAVAGRLQRSRRRRGRPAGRSIGSSQRTQLPSSSTVPISCEGAGTQSRALGLVQPPPHATRRAGPRVGGAVCDDRRPTRRSAAAGPAG